jgi:hypothetical protein
MRNRNIVSNTCILSILSQLYAQISPAEPTPTEEAISPTTALDAEVDKLKEKVMKSIGLKEKMKSYSGVVKYCG